MAKVDVSFHPQWWHRHAGISFTREFFTNETLRMEADMHMRSVLHERFLQSDLFKKPMQTRLMLDSDLVAGEYLQAQLLGCDVLFTKDNLPQVICAKLDDAQVWALKVPQLNENALWKDYEAQLKRLCACGSSVESALDLYGVQNLAFALRGEQLYIDYYDDPALARYLLKVCAHTLLAVARRVQQYTKKISGGVSAAIRFSSPEIYLTSNCTVDMVSPQIYEDFLLEWDTMLARTFGVFAVHHCGAHCERFAQQYTRLPGLQWLEAGAFSDFAAVRRHYTGLLNLRYSPRCLLDTPGNTIREDVHKQFDAASVNGRHALTTMSCVGIDAQTPDEAVLAFLEGVSSVK